MGELPVEQGCAFAIMEQEVEEVGSGDVFSADTRKGLSRNPLMASGGLIRPVARIPDKGKGRATAEGGGQAGWRRVQDDNADNEIWILDGGIQGGQEELQTGEEPACG